MASLVTWSSWSDLSKTKKVVHYVISKPNLANLPTFECRGCEQGVYALFLGRRSNKDDLLYIRSYCPFQNIKNQVSNRALLVLCAGARGSVAKFKQHVLTQWAVVNALRQPVTKCTVAASDSMQHATNQHVTQFSIVWGKVAARGVALSV